MGLQTYTVTQIFWCGIAARFRLPLTLHGD